MADLESTLARVERECREFASEWLSTSAVVLSERRYNFIKIRIRVTSTILIEIYHNAQNGRGSYALIRDNQRIFGYDGVMQWHRHPFRQPDKHVPCAKPRLSQALREMKHIIESLAGEENV